MIERFTDKARKVVFLAKGKATERGDDQIRPVHMLYGLVAADGVAARVLVALGVDAAAVDRELGRAGGAPSGAGGPGAAATHVHGSGSRCRPRCRSGRASPSCAAAGRSSP